MHTPTSIIAETNNIKRKKKSYLSTILNNRCPHCREGKLFVSDNAYKLTKNMKMHESCLICGQKTEIEIGFYYGTSYVSYVLTVAISLITFIAWYILIGVSVNDNRIFYWLAVNGTLIFVLQPLLMRLARTLWLSFFVNYDPDWKMKEATKYERIVESEMNNW